MSTAIQAIYRDLEYAKTLIKHKHPDGNPDNNIGDEESWTFVGDESDPELLRRIAEWTPTAHDHRKHSVTPTPQGNTKEDRHAEGNSKPIKGKGEGLGINFLRRASRSPSSHT